MEMTVCKTRHLTTFGGGGEFLKLNTIDFTKAFEGFSNVGENPTIFTTVLALFGVYFLLWIWAFVTDRRDREKVIVTYCVPRAF